MTGDTEAAATEVASTEPTGPQGCPEPEPTGPSLDIGVVAQIDNEVSQNSEGLAFDAAGNAYVSFAPLGQIVRLVDDESGAVVIGAIPGWDDPFPGIGGLTFDDVGNLYVTDSNSGSADDQAALGAVWRISSTGEVVQWAEDVVLGGTDEIGIGPIGANGLAINDDQIYVAVAEKASIVEIPILDDDAPGPISVFATNDALTFVEGVAVAPDGTVFAVEAFTDSVVAVNPDGTCSTRRARP